MAKKPTTEKPETELRRVKAQLAGAVVMIQHLRAQRNDALDAIVQIAGNQASDAAAAAAAAAAADGRGTR